MAEQRRPTALILVFGPVTNDSRIFREAATLRDLGFDVSIAGVVSAGEQLTEVRINGFRVIRLTPVESLRRILRRSPDSRPRDASGGTSEADPSGAGRREPRLAALRRLAIASAYYLQGVGLVRRLSPQLVHANDYNTMWIGVAAKLLRGSRLVYDAHELWPDQGRPEWRRWLVACEWLFLRLADAKVAANPGISETLAKRYRVTPPVVVRNVAERVVRSPAPAEGLRAGRAPLAVHVGSLTAERGIEQAIHALALVAELRLRLMGSASDDYRARLDDLAAEAGVADRIEYRTPVDSTAVTETIAGADMGLVLTQPTCLNNVLSLPNKLFEYTAAGLPVVASDLPVLGAVIREEGIGEIVPPTDIDAIAQAMRDLADPERNAEARERVRSFADRVTWEQERRLLEAVYAP
jgi:glycosyltransferase involved in cell wall biosynthesis